MKKIKMRILIWIWSKNKRSKTINYEATLPLKNEPKYFIDIIKGKTIDKGTLNEGLDVVKILEMATNSLTTQKLSVYWGNLKENK